MIRIQKLDRPNKRSGYNLKIGETTKTRGLIITNNSAGKKIYVDKWTAPKKKKKKTKKKK